MKWWRALWAPKPELQAESLELVEGRWHVVLAGQKFVVEFWRDSAGYLCDTVYDFATGRETEAYELATRASELAYAEMRRREEAQRAQSWGAGQSGE